MFAKAVGIMLYVDNVAEEKLFWSAIGFNVFNESEIMGFETFDMKPDKDSSVTFTVYAKEFIRQVSPEVIDMKPSILFETTDIVALQEKVASVTDTTSSVNNEPFPNFNFANPTGDYFAVKGLS